MAGSYLIIGAGGQIGMELTEALREREDPETVIASDIREVDELKENGPFLILDVMDKEALFETIKKYNVKEIYHLAAVLSAKGEKKPDFAWRLNMDSLLNVLEAARELEVDRVFWPSSIAVFGPNTPQENTPQFTVMDPNTVYGISKLAGERWCEYYHEKFGVDVRSLRYPGLIGYKSLPGGGTTDYAVDIFHEALKNEEFTCFLKEDTGLPMMYMPDAIRATLDLMQADADRIKIRSSYNVAGLSFTPGGIASSIQKHIAGFSIKYDPDFRQQIADSWPSSIDDSQAHTDWDWQPKFGLEGMVADMLTNIRKQYQPSNV